MTWPIHHKIQRLLKERKQRKKDLAAFLGIAPQTMTDICKGRSAVTLQHLRGIIRYFRIRADFWLDDSREHPETLDQYELVSDSELRQFEQLEIPSIAALSQTLAATRQFVLKHRKAWEQQFDGLDSGVARTLGIRQLDESEDVFAGRSSGPDSKLQEESA